jgi:hypothetical protein
LEKAGGLAPKLIQSTIVDTKQEIASGMNVVAVPTTLIVDAEGQVIQRVTGHLDAAILKTLGTPHSK